MKIQEYADIIDGIIKIESGGQLGWLARFEGCDLLVGRNTLKGEYGCGKTPELALTDYVDRIKGGRIVFLAVNGHKERREFDVPNNLEI